MTALLVLRTSLVVLHTALGGRGVHRRGRVAFDVRPEA